MRRRSFFQRVFGGVVAAVVAPSLPKPARPMLTIPRLPEGALLDLFNPPPLRFHPDAFSLVMEPLKIDPTDFVFVDGDRW